MCGHSVPGPCTHHGQFIRSGLNQITKNKATEQLNHHCLHRHRHHHRHYHYYQPQNLGRQINRNRSIQKKERTTKQKQNYTNSREKIKEKKKSKSASCRDKAASCGHSFSCFSVRVKGKATENYYTKKGKVHGEK